MAKNSFTIIHFKDDGTQISQVEALDRAAVIEELIKSKREHLIVSFPNFKSLDEGVGVAYNKMSPALFETWHQSLIRKNEI